LAWPALDSGRLLEVASDGDPRGMTVHDKTRLIDRLSLPFILINDRWSDFKKHSVLIIHFNFAG